MPISNSQKTKADFISILAHFEFLLFWQQYILIQALIIRQVGSEEVMVGIAETLTPNVALIGAWVVGPTTPQNNTCICGSKTEILGIERRLFSTPSILFVQEVVVGHPGHDGQYTLIAVSSKGKVIVTVIVLIREKGFLNYVLREWRN